MEIGSVTIVFLFFLFRFLLVSLSRWWSIIIWREQMASKYVRAKRDNLVKKGPSNRLIPSILSKLLPSRHVFFFIALFFFFNFVVIVDILLENSRGLVVPSNSRTAPLYLSHLSSPIVQCGNLICFTVCGHISLKMLHFNGQLVHPGQWQIQITL